MSLVVPPAKLMTAEEFMALPDDGVDRELIHGELREYPITGERPMTWRNHSHADVVGNVSYLIKAWIKTTPEPHGRVPGGEAGFLLLRNPDTIVGIDSAYVTRDVIERTVASGTKCYDGPPTLAVEVLSPSDRHEDIVNKVKLYHSVNTVVWVIDPDFRTVTVCRPGHKAETFNDGEELSGEPYLPGFRAAVAEFFE